MPYWLQVCHSQGHTLPAFRCYNSRTTRCSRDASNVGVGSTSSDQGSAAASSSSPVSLPWQIVDYHTKKLRRKTGASSDRDAADIETIAEPAQFTQQAKMALAVKVMHEARCAPWLPKLLACSAVMYP